jgi:hypothetical protein
VAGRGYALEFRRRGCDRRAATCFTVILSEAIMDELIARASAAAGLDATTAAKSVGLVLAFLQKEGPTEEVGEIIAAVPGAADLVAASQSGSGSGGIFAKLPGGGLMGLAGQLTGLGLGMDQMRAVGHEIFAFAREQLGEDKVGTIIASIPGLAGFV